MLLFDKDIFEIGNHLPMNNDDFIWVTTNVCKIHKNLCVCNVAINALPSKTSSTSYSIMYPLAKSHAFNKAEV